ncbi:unnamed protein product [Phytophthora fragariaefolia]|uniref:Unnamed protein product n=1 Tax=Phytophthora fragariaefolia TaxID=1490495 RepID=A0A9W6Y8N4_9STRA|nr:unnamed protein product [Phytophthora fragariaefolia]
MFVGYSRERKGYRLLDSNTNKQFYSHPVVFYETKPGRILLKEDTATPNVPTTEYLDVDMAAMQNILSLLEELQSERHERHELKCRTGGEGEGPVKYEVSEEERVQQIERSLSETKASRKRVKVVNTQVPHKKVCTEGQAKKNDAASPKPKMNTPNQMKRKRARRKMRSSERCATLPNDNLNSGRCMIPIVQQEDKNEKVQWSSTRKSGDIATTTNEKLDADGDSRVDDVTVSDQRDAPRSKAPKTGCREYRTKSGRVSKPPRWLGDTIHLALRDSIEKKKSASSTGWDAARDQMHFEIAKERQWIGGRTSAVLRLV